jgi:hypothetical protein
MISLSSLAVLAAAICLLTRFLWPAPTEESPIHFRFSDLWNWRGTVDRGTFVVVGVVAFAIKHNVDRIVATYLFGRQFTPVNYWIPPVQAIRIDRLSTGDARFLLTMLAFAVPFIWIGLAMTTRRLRSARLPLWLVALFFVPIVNVAFFVLLSIIPAETEETAAASRRGGLSSFIPHDRWGSSAMAVVLTGSIGAFATYIGVQRLGTYGWGVFVALPFCFGLVSVMIYCHHEPRTLRSCLAVSMTSVGLVASALFAFAVEGLICIVMALPIAIPLSLLGGFVGFLIQRRGGSPSQADSITLLLMLVPFGVMTMERVGPAQPPRLSVHTSVQINAPTMTVWKNLIEFPDIQEPPTSLFRFGVSYPIRARISAEGAGTIRECLFSTGTYVEKINVWEEGRRLGFTVVSGPEGMREWSPYDIHPRHLDGYFVPESAEFRLTPTPDGGTQLDGVSWYRNSMWPVGYWRLWSDALLHQVHMRVFQHIKKRSESRSQNAQLTS